jgi:DDE superfamily endonuclease
MAYLVLLDESGLLMAPLVKRTWALRGHRPEIRQKGKHREKVSLAAALWLSPRRDQLGLVYRTLINDYFNNEKVALFLEVLMREIPAPLVVLWDRGNMHKGDPIRDELKRFQPRLSIEKLPAWAPMLDPVEPIFSWLKYGRLSNYAPMDARELNLVVLDELRTIREDQDCLRKFWHASDRPLPRTLKKRHYFCDKL